MPALDLTYLPPHPGRLAGIRIYLAGRYARRDELAQVADALEAEGAVVTSRWVRIDASMPRGDVLPTPKAIRIAEMDLADLQAADVCIAFTEPSHGPQGRGGRHVELGAALALGQRVIIVGPREHVFHCLPQVEQHDSSAAAMAALSAQTAPRAAVG